MLTIQCLLFILINLLVLASCSIMAQWLSFSFAKKKYYFLLSLFVLYYALIIISEELLGIFNLLTFSNLLIFHGILLSLCVSIQWFVFKKRPFTITSVQKEPKEKNWYFFFFSLLSPILLLLLIRFFNATLQVPLEYDNIAYHLPFVAEWFQTESLRNIYYSAFAGPLAYYPSNFELFDLWVILPFGRDYLINLVNLPVSVFLMISLYAVARNFKLHQAIALSLVGLFFFMPQTLRQIGVPLVDLFLCFTFITSLFFLQEYAKDKKIGTLILFGISTGVFVGTKYLGIVYAVPLVGILIGITLFSKKLIKEKLLHIITIPICMTLTGGFWYIRNWIDAGNPLFPMEVKIFGRTIFQEYYGVSDRLLSYSLLNNVTNIGKMKEFLSSFFQMVGAQTFLIPLVLAGSILCLLWKIIRFFTIKRNKNLHKEEIIIFTLFILGLLFYFYTYWQAPYTYINLIPNVRYAMMFLLIATLATGFLVQKFSFLANGYFFVIFCIFAYNMAYPILHPAGTIIPNDRLILDFKVILSYPFLFIQWIFMILLIFFSTKILSVIRQKYRKRISFVILCVVIVSVSISYMKQTIPIRAQEMQRYNKLWNSTPDNSNKSLFEAALWIDQHAPQSNIAYSGLNFHYYLFGQNLQRKVDYININDCLDCRYADYKNSKDSIRRDPNYDFWLRNLKEKQKDFLILAPLATPNVKSYEYEWAQQHPEIFEKVFEQDNIYIFKIKK